jgi:uncharacterized membrane protein YdjX (TVP38/TMEM64 family)
MEIRVEAAPLPRPFPPPSRWQRWWRSRGLRWLLLVALAGFALVRGIEAFGGAPAIRERLGAGAALVLVPVQIVVSVSPVPGEIVAAVNVAIYGLWVGAALCWLAWLGAAFVEYALVRRTTREVSDASRSLERLPAFLRRLPVHHPAFLIFARYLPFGAHVVNVTAGLHGVPPWRFGWTAALALVPASLVFAAVTHGLLSAS